MKSFRNHLPPLESHFYSSSIFTPPTTASFSPHALSARLPPLQVFFSRILPVLSSPRLASPLPPFSSVWPFLSHVLLHSCIRPFSNSLCWAQPQLQTYIPKELKHLMFGWKWKREKNKKQTLHPRLICPVLPPSLPLSPLPPSLLPPLPSPSASLHPALHMFLPIQNVVCLSSLKCFSSRLLHQN